MNVKHITKKLLLRSRLLALFSSSRAPMVAILRYHSVQPAPETFATTIGTGIMHSAAEFKAHMALIRSEFVPVTLDQVLRWLKDGTPVPRRAVAITFDDGFHDNYSVAAPILHHYGLRATFYVSVAWINSRSAPWFCRLRHAFFTTTADHWYATSRGERSSLEGAEPRLRAFLRACHLCATLAGAPQAAFVSATEQQLGIAGLPETPRLMMSWDELRELHRQGHIIGSHTMTHPNMAYVDAGTALHELAGAKDILERELSTTVYHFSYPSPCLDPHCTESTIAISRQAGYRTAVTCLSGAAHRHSNPLCLPRLVCSRDVVSLHWDIETSFLGRHR